MSLLPFGIKLGRIDFDKPNAAGNCGSAGVIDADRVHGYRTDAEGASA
jgi:hypothetical protein